MAKDLRNTKYGDLYVSPATHDLTLIDGVDEIAQRIKATLEIRFGEMVNLDPEQGADYSNFLGKNFNATLAADDMKESIMAHVPEVDSVDNLTFTKLPNRVLRVDFQATATPTGSQTSQEVEGGYEIGA